MSFFAVLLALLIEQLKPLPRDNWVFGALIGWMRWTGLNFNAGRDHHAWVVWGVTAIVPALASFGVEVEPGPAHPADQRTEHPVVARQRLELLDQQGKEDREETHRQP